MAKTSCDQAYYKVDQLHKPYTDGIMVPLF